MELFTLGNHFSFVFSSRSFPFRKEHHVWFILPLHRRFSLVLFPQEWCSVILSSPIINNMPLSALLHRAQQVTSTPDKRFYLVLYIFIINFWQVAQYSSEGAAYKEPVDAVWVQPCAPAVWIWDAVFLYGLLSGLQSIFGNSGGKHWRERWSWKRYECGSSQMFFLEIQQFYSCEVLPSFVTNAAFLFSSRCWRKRCLLLFQRMWLYNLGHVSELHQLETSKWICSDIWPTYLVIPLDKTFIWIFGLQCG